MKATTTHKSRHAHKQHRFAGEVEGLPLVEWLNGVEKDPARANIAEALTLFREVDPIRKQLGGDILDHPDIVAKSNRMHWLLAADCNWRPILLPEPMWVPTDSDQLLSREKGGSFRYRVEHAVQDITRLAEKRLLWKVRQCLCGRWIFARTPQEIHCSAACRMKAWRAKPDWAEHQREWRLNNIEAHARLETGGKMKAAKKKRGVR